ncbi:MAG: methyltransferase domain-containing protein [Deltaproteobacteria bacterium]|nr:methyltransferase domain-containing protein [Deltaproteobacteria bacterium]
MRNRSHAFDYLQVDDFLSDVVSARALATALELRLIDFLLENQPVPKNILVEKFQGDRRGIELLLELICNAGVTRDHEGAVILSAAFEKALAYRDLLEAKLQFARVTAPDFLDHFTALVHSPELFRRRARIFDLFGYDRSEVFSRENLQRTREWARLTTALTRYEARVLMEYHDFGNHRLMLDIGGNSGELALCLCRKHPGLRATVFDLPLVCHVGRDHLLKEPEADRIAFVEGNGLKDPLPRGFDLVCFKSMLHDWPDPQAWHLLESAARCLRSGGTLLIFERQRPEAWPWPLPYSLVPFLLFFRSYRTPSSYETQLKGLGFQEITRRRIELDMPFMLVTGVKK